jgi:hypothetical protein
MVPTDWRGCCDDYRERGGCRIPTQARVSWLLDDGSFEYWRGKVTAYGMRLRREKAGLLTWISAVAGRGRKILSWIGGCITKAVIENLALRQRTGALRSP